MLLTLFVLSGCGDQSADTGASDRPTTARPVAEEPVKATDDPASKETEETTVQPEAETPGDAEKELAPQGTVVTVDRTVSGDTIRISPAVEGKRVVRLIGIDAPETGGQPFGDAARAQANSLVGSRKVALEFDTKRIDESGRLLAYVRLPGRDLLNEFMLRAGYAQVETSSPNVKYEDELREAQRAAREGSMGLWELPPQQLCKLADHGNGIGGGCEDLSNASDSGSSGEPGPQRDETPVAGVPPVPPDGDYDCGHFNNQQQAQKVLDSDPSDPHDLDGENQNGVACEELGR